MWMHVFIFLEAFLVGILLHYRWRTLEKACHGITMNWLPWQRRLDIVCSQPLIPPLESLTPGLVFHCYFMHFKKLNTVHMSWLYFVLFNVASTFLLLVIHHNIHWLFCASTGFPIWGTYLGFWLCMYPELSKAIALGCMSFFISMSNLLKIN